MAQACLFDIRLRSGMPSSSRRASPCAAAFSRFAGMCEPPASGYKPVKAERGTSWFRRTAASLSAVVLSIGVAHAAEITDGRLLDAGSNKSEWLMNGRTYAADRFSPLDQIDTGNVARLAPAWIYQTGKPATFQATPLVADGVMYLPSRCPRSLRSTPRPARSCGITSTRRRPRNSAAGRPIAASGSATARSTSRPSMPTSWRSTPRPASWPGTSPWRRRRRARPRATP